MRIVYLSLDDRPLNYAAVRRATTVSPIEVLFSPRELIGGRVTAPELFPVARWLIQHTEGSSLVLSLDALMHGGLVQARTAKASSPRPQEALKLLGALAHKATSASAFLVWKRVWGNIFTSRGLARMPSFQQASLELAEMAQAEDVASLYQRLSADPIEISGLPADDVSVLARSRLRMLAEGKAVCEACATAGIKLHIAVEDSIKGGVQEAELRWLQCAVSAAQFTIADGADEAGAVLVAGAMAKNTDSVPVKVFAERQLEIIAPYESRTIADNLKVLCALAGAEVTQSLTLADVFIANVPEEGDKYSDLIAGKLAPANTVDLMAAIIPAISFLNTITCDLAATNGINPALLKSFAAQELPPFAIAQMNTASNRIGHALLIAAVSVEAPASDAMAKLVVEHYLEDLFYQAHLRTYLVSKYGGIEPESDDVCAKAEAEISQLAAAFAKRKFDGALIRGKTLHVEDVSAELPWKRWFEAEFAAEVTLA